MSSEPYPRRLLLGVTTTKKRGLVKAKECIKYIESCGWLFRGKNFGSYRFYNSSAQPEQRWMVFTLAGLRDAYINGW